jgi:hypothetical protein
MKNYVVHPSASEPLTEQQKRWRSWQDLVNRGVVKSAQPTEFTDAQRDKNKKARKLARKQRKVNKHG